MSKHFRSVVLLTLLSACSALAHAQKPTLIRNQDERGRSPYIQNVFFNQIDLCTTSSCNIVFPAVPAGFRLVITHVSFRFRLTSGTDGAYLVLGGAGFDTFGPQVDLLTPSSTGSFYSIISTPVDFYIEPGDTPVVQLNADGIAVNHGFSDHVSIVGYLVPLT